jgi:hypothetical protein
MPTQSRLRSFGIEGLGQPGLNGELSRETRFPEMPQI